MIYFENHHFKIESSGQRELFFYSEIIKNGKLAMKHGNNKMDFFLGKEARVFGD